MFFLPDGFARCMREVHGPAGDEWLKRLPAIVAECEQQWALRAGPPFPDLSYHYVAPAVRADGTEAVLKVGFPHRELATEIEALRLFGGHGVARMLAVDRERGAFLLERLQPGTQLWSLSDHAAITEAAGTVMQRLWRPAPEAGVFPHIADWAGGLGRLRARFGSGTGPLPAALVERAEGLFHDLLASIETPLLLHGDLHPGNILAAQREPWLAIDPKGILGEPPLEPYSLLTNLATRLTCEPHPERLLARRIDELTATLGVDRTRVRGWAAAMAVLSAWWTLEDHGSVQEQDIAVAEALFAVS